MNSDAWGTCSYCGQPNVTSAGCANTGCPSKQPKISMLMGIVPQVWYPLQITRLFELSAAVVRKIDTEEDKCPFCGDNQDHHPDCEQGKAIEALKQARLA